MEEDLAVAVAAVPSPSVAACPVAAAAFQAAFLAAVVAYPAACHVAEAYLARSRCWRRKACLFPPRRQHPDQRATVELPVLGLQPCCPVAPLAAAGLQPLSTPPARKDGHTHIQRHTQYRYCHSHCSILQRLWVSLSLSLFQEWK